MYAQSINARMRIEQVFGWIKQAAGLRQLKAPGRSKVGAVFRLHVVAYSLIRITNLLRAQSPEPAGGNGMKAPIKGPMALETGPEAGQSSLDVVHASDRQPVNLIDAVLMMDMNRAKTLASLAFSAAS